jgi:ssDNA-binding Zn-finger/Zn-ribbon topoisomerase 1
MGEYAQDAIDRGMTEYSRWSDDAYKIDQWKKYVYEGDDCPNSVCDGHMVKRVNRKTEVAFLGCSNFPKCKQSV